MGNKKQLTPRLNKNEPNIIIDGGMEIWPEGTSRSVANGTSLYGSSLFKCGNVSSVTLTNSQQASVPSGTNIPFSNQMSKTAAGTMSATVQAILITYIEGYDLQRLMSDEFSVMFWVKSSVASTRSLSILNGSTTHSFVQQYTIASANTWQLVVLKIPALTTCPGTLNRTNGLGLQISFTAVAGSTYQTSTLGSWVSGAFLSGVGEDTTWITGTTHDFSIAGVMVLPGDWRSLSTNTSQYRFLRSGRNFQEELAKTQRYFLLNPRLWDIGRNSTTTDKYMIWTFPTAMRTATTPLLGTTTPSGEYPITSATVVGTASTLVGHAADINWTAFWITGFTGLVANVPGFFNANQISVDARF